MAHATLRQLRAFASVARHRSFAQAAEELHLSPSAVSLQIKELEALTQVPLFGRSPKGVSLTRAGELLLVDVQPALLALERTDETMTRLRDRHAGLVSVGMVSSAEHFLPRLLAQFQEQHSELQLRLFFGNREQLLTQLRRGEVDLAVMGSPPADLEGVAEPFATQPLGIIAAPEHALSQARSVSLGALTRQPFILREPGSGTRAAVLRLFESARVPLPNVTEMTSNTAIKQAVMANLGLAFLSLHSAALELNRRLLVALDVVGLPVVRRWFVVNMNTPALPETALALRLYILSHGATSIAQHFEGITGAIGM